MKYKVGDIVKLSTGEKGTITKAWGRYSATIGDDNYDEYNFDEKEIIGLWEGRKPKLKLIDILNKIANGELKEGARVIWDFKEYIYDGQHELWRSERGLYHCDILEEICLGNLSEEVELIEPNDFGEADKMAEPTDNTKIEELDINALTWNDLLDYQKLEILFDKLNEVINKVNAQTTVVLAHQKDIEEIKNDLDY